MAPPGRPREGSRAVDGRRLGRAALSTLIGAAVAAAVLAAVVLNLPVRPPTGLTSTSGAAAAPNIRLATAGRVTTLTPSVRLAGSAAVATDFLSPGRGWAVVGCGTRQGTPTSPALPSLRPCSVIGTSDGGLTWTTLWRTSAQLVGIAFANWADGYAWTGRGACLSVLCPTRLYATSDGGRLWVERPVGATVWSSVVVTGASTLWSTVGGLLRRSDDAGRAWQIIPTLGCIAEGVRFDGPDGVVVGRNSQGLCADRTADGGATWQPLLTGLDAPAVRAAFARFVDSSGLGSVLGGPAAVRPGCSRGEGWPAGAKAAWLVVRCNQVNPDMLAVLHTADGGATWQLVWDTAGCTGACRRLGQGEDPLAFLGDTAWRTAGPAVATASLGGGPFRAGGRLCLAADCVPALELLSAARAVAATSQGVFATADGGATWQRLWPASGPGPLAAVSLVAPGVGLAVARLDPSTILETADGGRAWRVWGRLPAGVVAARLDFLTPRQGYVYGTRAGRPVLLYTADGPGRLRRMATPLSRGRPLALARIAFRTAATGLALDPFGDAWRTSDGARTWRIVAPMPLGLPQAAAWGGPRTLYALVASEPPRGRGAGGGASGHLGLVASTDAGAAFRPLAAWPWPPARGQFDATVLAAHGQDLWLFAYDGLLASTDGGATWTMVRLPPGRLAPTTLEFANAQAGWLLSASGALFGTDDGGRRWRQVSQGA